MQAPPGALPGRRGLGIFTPLLSAVATRRPQRASDYSRDRLRSTAQVSGLVSHRKRPGTWNCNRTGRNRSRSRPYLGCRLRGCPLFDGRLFLDCFFPSRLSGRLFFRRFPAHAFSRGLAYHLFRGHFLFLARFLLCCLLLCFCHENLRHVHLAVRAALRQSAPFALPIMLPR